MATDFSEDEQIAAAVTEIETSSGPLLLSTDDSLKRFADAFREFLMDTCNIIDFTVQKHTRIVMQVIKHSIGDDSNVDVSATCVIRAFHLCGKRDGFLTKKRETASANYCRTVVDACKKALEFMKLNDDNKYLITLKDYNACLVALNTYHSEYLLSAYKLYAYNFM